MKKLQVKSGTRSLPRHIGVPHTHLSLVRMPQTIHHPPGVLVSISGKSGVLIVFRFREFGTVF